MSITRRSFLRNAGGFATLPLPGSRAWAAMSRQTPELIFANGHVITMDPGHPIAQMTAILGVRILAVGRSRQHRKEENLAALHVTALRRSGLEARGQARQGRPAGMRGHESVD